jgi:hypothetical protein
MLIVRYNIERTVGHTVFLIHAVDCIWMAHNYVQHTSLHPHFALCAKADTFY